MASSRSDARTKVQEGLRALRAGKIGAALEAWDAALSSEPERTDAAAFRDYLKQNRIRIAVHIGRQPPVEGAPLVLPKTWPPAPPGFCDPPEEGLDEGESLAQATSASPSGDSTGEEDSPYDAVEIGLVADGSALGSAGSVGSAGSAGSAEAESAELDAESYPVLEIVLEDEPDNAFAEDAPTITRDPTSTPAGAASAKSTAPSLGARHLAETPTSRSASPQSPRPKPKEARPRGTLMGLGAANPFEGGLMASFGSGSPNQHFSPGLSSREVSFSDDKPTQAVTPDDLAGPRPDTPRPRDYDQSESSFPDDQPTQTRDMLQGRSPQIHPMPPGREGPSESSFSEDQVTIAREAPTPPPKERMATEEPGISGDPMRDLAAARLLHDEGAHERCNALLDRLDDQYGELPGSAALRAQNQAALQSLLAEQLGPLTARAIPRTPTQRLNELALDPRAAFLLSLVDGTLSLDDLLDISGMSREETIKILLKLRELGLLVFEPVR